MGSQIIPSLTARHMKKPTLAVNGLCMSVVSGTNKKIAPAAPKILSTTI